MSEALNHYVVPGGTKRMALQLLHCAQLLFAFIVLGLDAYGVRYVAYTVLVYSLVVVICTILTSSYLILSKTLFRKWYRRYVILGLHMCMLIFWIIDLGLVASLAMHWGQPRCSYTFAKGYSCSGYGKRATQTINKRDTTSYNTYSGTLAAGAVLAAFEIIFWSATAAIVALNFNEVWQDPTPAARNPDLFPSMRSSVPTLCSLVEVRGQAEQWASKSAAGITQRSGPEPILPEESDETPFSVPPPVAVPLRVMNRGTDSQSTLDVPNCSNHPNVSMESPIGHQDFAEAPPRPSMLVAPLNLLGLDERRAPRVAEVAQDYHAYQPERREVV